MAGEVTFGDFNHKININVNASIQAIATSYCASMNVGGMKGAAVETTGMEAARLCTRGSASSIASS